MFFHLEFLRYISELNDADANESHPSSTQLSYHNEGFTTSVSGLTAPNALEENGGHLPIVPFYQHQNVPSPQSLQEDNRRALSIHSYEGFPISRSSLFFQPQVLTETTRTIETDSTHEIRIDNCVIETQNETTTIYAYVFMPTDNDRQILDSILPSNTKTLILYNFNREWLKFINIEKLGQLEEITSYCGTNTLEPALKDRLTNCQKIDSVPLKIDPDNSVKPPLTLNRFQQETTEITKKRKHVAIEQIVTEPNRVVYNRKNNTHTKTSYRSKKSQFNPEDYSDTSNNLRSPHLSSPGRR